jgi:hypothetical protein
MLVLHVPPNRVYAYAYSCRPLDNFSCYAEEFPFSNFIFQFQGYMLEMAWLSISPEQLGMKSVQERLWTSFCLAPLLQREMVLPARNVATSLSLRES